MELKLKGYGTIEITKSTLVEDGDILIETSDYFEKLAETTEYEITEVYLVNNGDRWVLIAWFDLPEDDWYADKTIAIHIENQEDIHNLLKEICKEI